MAFDTVPARLAALREKMKTAGAAACLIPTNDDHMSEYVCGHWTSREYFSGFTGSAGTLVVLADEAALWTDGRYHLQAADQLAGSGIVLMKDGLPDTPGIREYLEERLPAGGVLAFDGRCLPAKEGIALLSDLAGKGTALLPDFDPANGIREDRPALPDNPVTLFAAQYAGESASSKLARMRARMEEEGAELLYITKLDEIAWLLNLRGSDIDYNPVFLAFLAITLDGCVLYIDGRKLAAGANDDAGSDAAGANDDTDSDAAAPSVSDCLADTGIEIRPYESVYEDAALLSGVAVMASLGDLNYRLYSELTEAGTRILDLPSPVLAAKCIKNETEIANSRRVHIKDGAAMVRFMKWLKELRRGEDGRLYDADDADSCVENGANGNGAQSDSPVTELSAARRLDSLRGQIPGSRGLSFSTISGYGPHGAIIHYEVTPASDVPLQSHGLYLVDSGGQYDEGTTDITRTFALGPLTEEEKENFALVLRAALHLMNARFPGGVCFENLDVLARLPLWEKGLDYRHGTGHGVGHVLSVHEGPNRFHWKPAGGAAGTKIEPGMVTTDEPGVYIAGRHGIRTENELLCVEKEESEYGRFLGFECLTYCPIDLDAVDANCLDEREIAMLNDYHARVYEALAPGLTEDERAWLRTYTRPISK